MEETSGRATEEGCFSQDRQNIYLGTEQTNKNIKFVCFYEPNSLEAEVDAAEMFTFTTCIHTWSVYPDNHFHLHVRGLNNISFDLCCLSLCKPVEV